MFTWKSEGKFFIKTYLDRCLGYVENDGLQQNGQTQWVITNAYSILLFAKESIFVWGGSSDAPRFASKKTANIANKIYSIDIIPLVSHCI